MSSSGKSHMILVAEDEAMLRMAVVELLEDAGYHVLAAANGEEGCRLLKSEEPIDLLVSDIKMPGMNGYQLAEAGLALRPCLRVVLMTGYAQEPLPAAIKAAGGAIMYKPFDFGALVATVQKLLQDKPG